MSTAAVWQIDVWDGQEFTPVELGPRRAAWPMVADVRRLVDAGYYVAVRRCGTGSVVAKLRHLGRRRCWHGSAADWALLETARS